MHKFIFYFVAIFFLILSQIANSMESQNLEFNDQNKINKKSLVVAGGCFWCMEQSFDQLKGVISTTSGYIGGDKKTATYPQVSSGLTQHIEAMQVVYDANRVGFKKLIELFWLNIDPLDQYGQFCDRGAQYTTAIFYNNDEEKLIAEEYKKEIEIYLGEKVHTRILKETSFFAAEDYHQNYYKTNPIRYKYYRFSCGRDQRLKKLWGDAAGGKNLNK